MASHSREEVERHYLHWRAAIDRRDLDAMAAMLTEDARGGNAQFGMFEGRDAIIGFSRERWPETVPNRSLWHAIDDFRVVDKWRETLPGDPGAGRVYHYHGITELLYAGGGQWSFMYGIPDIVGLMRVYGQWRRDGHAEVYGEVYPGIPR